MSDLDINELLAGMQASGLRTIVITDEEAPMKEDRLSRMCDLLFELNREAILRDGDWWYGTDDYDINFFDWEDKPDHMTVVVYDMTKGEYFQYTEEQTIFSKHIYTGAKA
jgi:hypothetical protein